MAASRFRLIVGYGAIACAIPYLALKIVWLTGGRLGVADATMMSDPSMFVLNLVTAGMDLVAIGMALAFTHAWGQRLPSWLVLTPAWVGMGLLIRFVLAVPILALAGILTTRSIPAPGGPVHSWVYALVYTEFVGMGIGLTLAFVLYARVRWNWVFVSTVDAFAEGATHGVQVPLAHAAAVLAAAAGILHLARALRTPVASSVVNTVDGVVMVAGATGVLMLVLRVRPQKPFWIPLALTWIGSGFLFAWGLWGLVNVLGNTALVRSRPSAVSWVDLVGLIQLLAGVIIGLVMLFALAEREAAARHLLGAGGAWAIRRR